MNSRSPFLAVSRPDVSILGQINCARIRLLVVAPGLTEQVAPTIAPKWIELGRDAVRVVLDPDPDICRLGYGDLSGLELLHRTAAELGTTVLVQGGIRIGIELTDETTTIFAPAPRLVELGGEPGERTNAVQFDLPGTSEHRSGRDDATAEDISLRPWKSRWPCYIRVHDAEFADGTMRNGVSLNLNQMLDELGADAWASTSQRATQTGGKDIDSRASLRQQRQLQLTPIAIRGLSEYLERFDADGKVSRDELARLDWPAIPSRDQTGL